MMRLVHASYLCCLIDYQLGYAFTLVSPVQAFPVTNFGSLSERPSPNRAPTRLWSTPREEDVAALEALLGAASPSESVFEGENGAVEPKTFESPGRSPGRSPGVKESSEGSVALMDQNVPAAQQPAQELNDLKSAPVFKWAQLQNSEFLQRIALVYAGVFVFVSLPISVTTYPLFSEPIKALAAANFGTVALVFCLLLRLYVGWSYLGDRLTNEVGYFEETGWYDGFLAVKPPEIASRDKLLYVLEVEPAVDRVKVFGAASGGLLLASFLLLKIAAPNDPYEQFDPNYLANLQQDDNLASYEQRRGDSPTAKPTYCDSRYYRAVSGGNGC